MEEEKGKTTVDTNSIRRDDVPFDLITEILSWLPAKSVLRFKSVSRSWYQLINQLINKPWFINIHLRRSLEANPDTYMVEMRNSKEKRLHSLASTTNQANNDYGFQVTEYTHPRNISNNPFHTYLGCSCGDGLKAITWVIGSCNGLLCLYTSCSNKEIISYLLYNPVTRDLRKFLHLDPTKNIPLVVGFGYDYVSNDYKVLGYYPRDRTSMLYSLKRDAWEDTFNLPSSVPLKFYPPILANNTLYWMKGWSWTPSYPKLGYPRATIVCFDLSTRRYYHILYPDQARYSDLMISRGQLYVVTRKLDIWLLNKHDSTWTRIFRHQSGQLNKYLDITRHENKYLDVFYYHQRRYDRVCCLKDGHNIILAFFVSGNLQIFLICCDLETNEAWEIEATNLDHLKSVLVIHPWVGSFAPLH